MDGGASAGLIRTDSADALTASGADCYPTYGQNRWTVGGLYTRDQRFAADFWTQAIILDTYRSIAPNKPIIDSEYHVVTEYGEPYGVERAPADFTPRCSGRDRSTAATRRMCGSVSAEASTPGSIMNYPTIFCLLSRGRSIRWAERRSIWRGWRSMCWLFSTQKLMLRCSELEWSSPNGISSFTSRLHVRPH